MLIILLGIWYLIFDSWYSIGYLDKVMEQLVLPLPKMRVDMLS